MKNYFLMSMVIGLVTATTLSIISCQKENDEATGTNVNPELEVRTNSAFYPATAHPFGQSFEEWAIAYWQKAMSFDCPTINTSHVVSLDDNVSTLHVYYGDNTINITVSKDKALFISLASAIDDYPCPDPDFVPTPGQSLQDFLQADVLNYVNAFVDQQVSLDGVALQNVNNYRLVSNLFYFTGNSDLTDCLDPCVTGSSQAGVTGGYFVMLKKMQPGAHTITLHGLYSTYNFQWDITVNVTVQ